MSTQATASRARTVNLQQVVLLGILLVFCVVFAATTRSFFSGDNISDLVRQGAFVIITGAGVTLLMISGNIDLSVGSVVALAGVVYAYACKAGIPMPVSALLGCLTGLAIGGINAFTVVKLKVTPFIATLGTMYAVRGFGFIITDARTVRDGLPANFSFLDKAHLGPIPLAFFIVLAAAALFYSLEKKALLGKYSVAIGGNRTAAILSGINADAVVARLYMIVGLLAGICGVMMGARLAVGDPNVGVGFEFDVIIAVILGGTALSGGEGSIIGMIIGALIVEVIGNGLNLLNVLSFWQSIIKGILLVVAVLLNQSLRERLRSAVSGNRAGRPRTPAGRRPGAASVG
jgi:ribose/xylose/arabinose/galactoside ABC-type transport system permease subunit